MAKKVEVFENEEATKFLDYYVSYIKFQNLVDTIKAAQGNQPNPSVEPLESHTGIDELVDPHSSIAFPITLDK
jgi:hypothetical protein